MKNGLAGLMQQAQKMQAQMQKAQEELKNIEVEGAAGGGMVKVTVLGSHEVKRVVIDPSVLSGDDKEMFEDLIAAAVNDAVHKLEKVTQEKMSNLASGLSLPPGMKLPF